MVLLVVVLSSRTKRKRSVPISGHEQEEGMDTVAVTSNSANHSLINSSITDPFIMDANSTTCLINSDHSPSLPHHIHNSCSCSCHARSTQLSGCHTCLTHSLGPSQKSNRSRQMNNMSRYGYPYTAEMPPVMHQSNHHSTVAPPTSLNLTQQQVPVVQIQELTPGMINIQVKEQTPVMINVRTLPFQSNNELDENAGNLPCQNPQRPTHLDIPEKPRHQGSGSSRPVSDNIVLAVTLNQQHQNCNNRKYCPCCNIMITKQFEKIAHEQGQDTLKKAMKDIQIPGTEGHKQMMNRRDHTPCSPYQPGLTLGGDLKQRCSSSTSKVHEEELTSETEEDKKSVRKARSSHKVHTNDEMEFFLPVSSVNMTNKDLASSEPDLTTPIALPPSLLYQGVTPTNPAPLVTKSPAKMKPDSLDDSSSSSSNPQLDVITPMDETSKSLLLSSAATTIGSDNIAMPQLSTKEPVVCNESDKKGKIPPLSVSNYSPTHNNNTSLQPVQSDIKFSDRDSYRESSPTHLILGSPKAKRKGQEGKQLSPVLATPSNHPRGTATHHSDHRAPYLMNGTSLHPYHASPPHKSSTTGGSYHHHTSVPGDLTSIHSIKRVQFIDSSDHSSSWSTDTIHSDDGVTTSNCYSHHHHHQPSGRLGSKCSVQHSSANMISLPKESSTSTAL